MGIPGQTPDSIPRPSASAIHFLRSIDDSDYKKLDFSDRLTTFSDNGKEVGSFSISVSSSSSNGFSEGGGFVVRASSVGRLDGMLCGTKLTSHVSRHMLETIEHHQHDFLFLSDESFKRDTDIVKQANGFLISQTTSRGQDVKKTTRFVEHRNACGLITEGADLIIQRILALKGDIPSDFQLISFDVNCNIGPAKYERLQEQIETSPGMSSGLFGVCRTVATWKDKPLTWHSYLTSTGQLTFRHQIGSTVSMRLVPTDRAENGEDVGSAVLNCTESESTKRKSFASSYSNGKTKSSVVDSKTYLRHHPELNSITTDFLQLLLIQKPTNVPLFAANYFSALSSETDSSETTAVGTT